MTHPSGLQYSYDDLDLVCCHGVDSEGSWMGSGASKQGRRTRCASMPEGCHQLPTQDLAQTLEVTASVGIDDTKLKQLKIQKNHEEVPLDLQEGNVHGPHELVDVDISQRVSESKDLQTTNMGNSGEFNCNSNSGKSSGNISCPADSSRHCEKTITNEGEVGTESSQSHDICNDDYPFKRLHISREEQQCISISAYNGLPLSECAGEQPGKPPNHQETKESHTEGYSRPPEISEATLNQSPAAELEPQTDLPDVQEDTISTSEHASTNVNLPVCVLHSPVDRMDGGDVMSPAGKFAEPVVTLMVEGARDQVVRENWSADSADKLDGTNDLETLNENAGLEHHSRDIGGGERDHHDCTGVMDQPLGCEISHQTLLEQPNIEMTGMIGPHGEESVQAGSSEKTANARYEPVASSDICFKGQCCTVTVDSNVSSERMDNGYSEKDSTQANITQSADQYVEMSTSEDMDGSSVLKELLVCVDQTTAQQLDTSCSKLDTILEVGYVEPDDTSVLDPQKNIALNVTQNPDVPHSHTDDKHAVAEQHAQNLPSYCAEVSHELSPEGIHGNQASGRYFSESPASEVADGQREYHRPGSALSRMEETEEAAHTVTYSDTHFASPALDGSNEPGDVKEDVVKVRMRKVRLNLIQIWKGGGSVAKLRFVVISFVFVSGSFCCNISTSNEVRSQNELRLTGHKQPTNNFCPTLWQASRKTMTSLSHAYRSVSGGICEMFCSFSTAHCKTRSYKGMKTMNVDRVGDSCNLQGGGLLKQLSPAKNTVVCTIYAVVVKNLISSLNLSPTEQSRGQRTDRIYSPLVVAALALLE